MNKNQKPAESKNDRPSGGGLYIALAICILSVICVGVYSAIINIVGDTLSPAVQKDPVIAKADPPVQTESREDKSPVRSLPEPFKSPDRPVSVEPTEPEKEPQKAPEKEPDPPAEAPEVTSFTRPVGATLCRSFSENELLYSPTMNDYRTHLGADYKAGVGDAVHCFAAGTVESVTEDPLMGQTVVVDHGNGLKSIYQNLSPTLAERIREGAAVKEGEILGGVGETALVECEDESHLHFAVTVNGVPVDPENYFS